MSTSLQVVQPVSPNRRATQDEIEHAAMVLRSLGNEPLADLIVSEQRANLDGESIALVITDFSNLPWGTQVLLVPSGAHDVPLALLEQVQFVIGLAWDQADYPLLNLLGETTTVMNLDTLEETELCTGLSCARMAGVALAAPRKTIVEVHFGESEQFSDVFFNILWQHNVDAYNMASCTAYQGWDWVLNAYGPSMCRRRNTLEKGMDAAHEGMMNTIDGIFRPLVKLGEKLDRMLESK